MLKKQSSHLWVITIALFVVWTLLLFRMDEPFWGHHENPPTWMSAAVRTFNQYGPGAVNFMVVRTPGPTTPETGWYYMHHPPLIVWIEAVATQFFGYDVTTLAPYESSIRMVAYVATMLTLPLFYVVARRLTTPRIALISFLLYAATPVTLYFGRSPHYDVMLMPFVYAFVAVFINWMRRYTHWRTLALIVIAVAMMWVDWPGAFYLTAMGIMALVFGKRRQRIAIFVIGIVTIIFTLAIPLMYETLRPGSTGEILEIFELRRTNRQADLESKSFTLVQFFARYLKDMMTTTTLAVSVLGLVGFIHLLVGTRQFKEWMIFSLVITPLVFMAIVPNSFFFHDWYELHFLASFSIAAGIIIYKGWQIQPDRLHTRYIKPFIVAILITSLGITVWWTIGLHQTSKNNLFGREVAAALPIYTDVEDTIMSNVTHGFNKIEYYAYRTVIWGIMPDDLNEWLQTQGSIELYYLLCLEDEAIEMYDGLFSEYNYEAVTDDCRLIHIVNDGASETSAISHGMSGG